MVASQPIEADSIAPDKGAWSAPYSNTALEPKEATMKD